MRALLVLLLVGACASEPPIPLEQACAEGQRAIEGWFQLPERVSSLWEFGSHSQIAVVARRVTEPVLVSPSEYFFSDVRPSSRATFYTCHESAEHEVLDGLGWTDVDRIDVASSTGEGFWGNRNGEPLRGNFGVVSEHFYEDYLSIAPDDDVYFLVLQPLPNGSHFVRWRARLTEDGMIAGDNTTSGEPVSLDVFRR